MTAHDHPLFDPTSRYHRFRAALRPDDKMRGYFHWLSERRARAAVSGAAADARSRQAAPAEYALSANTRLAFVVRADELSATVPAKVVPRFLPATEGETRVDLQVELMGGATDSGPVPFRALVIEPDVWARLATADPALGKQPSEPGVFRLLSADSLARFEIARLLSAVPEFNGTIGRDGVGRSAAYTVPTGAAVEFPASTLLLIVLGPPLE